MSSASDANAAAVQHAVAVAMKNMPVSDKAAAIASRMKANEAKKSLYYSVLAEAGVPEAVDIISEGFSDGTPSQKDDAFRALLNVQGMAARRSAAGDRFRIGGTLCRRCARPLHRVGGTVRRYGGE